MSRKVASRTAARWLRAGVAPASPVYHDTVFAAVPAMSEVAVANGGPLVGTRGRRFYVAPLPLRQILALSNHVPKL